MCAKDDKPGKDKANQADSADNFNYNYAEQYKLFQLNQYLNRYYSRPLFLFKDLKLNTLLLAGDFDYRLVQKPGKRLGRAVLEGLGHMLYATISYWIRQDVMREDWEYQFNWEDQKRRFFFTDGMRFDSNSFTFNWTHSLAGAVYYNYARANHFNPLESFLFSFGVSYFWEFVVEFKEMVSINDTISTPMGGPNIGESLFQLGRFFRSRRPTFINKIARFISNPMLTLNELLDGKKRKYRYGFDRDYWHDCRLFAGPRFDTFSGGPADTFLYLGLESQLVLLPEYGMPGISRFPVKKTLFTELNIGGTIGGKGLYEFSIYAKSVLFGYFSQNIRSRAGHTFGGLDPGMLDDIDNDDRVGYSFFLGAATVFETIRRDPLKIPGYEGDPAVTGHPDREDKYTIINLVGPTFDLSLFYKNLKIRLAADAYGDFSLIHSHAFKDYSQLHRFGQTKSTLENHGYYYALGVTLSSMLQVDYSNIEFRGKLKYHYFNSIEGLDRFQRDMADEDDFDLKDHRFRYDVSLGYRIPNTSLQLVLGLEQIDRRGYIGDFFRHSKEKRPYFQIKYLF